MSILHKQVYIQAKLYITCLLLTLLSACSSESNKLPDMPTDNTGTLELRLENGSATRATTTVISKEEADNFLITIYKGTDLYRETAKLKDIDKRISAGYGYTVKAESCSETVAESSNGGWGQRRYAGLSQPFAIKAGEITKVGVACTVANAGWEIIFDESFPLHFTDSYIVKYESNGRKIVFDKNTGGRRENGEIVSDGNVAYFNIASGDKQSITYTIEAFGEGKRLLKQGTLTLTKGKISRLSLAFIPGTLDLDIIVDQEDIFINDKIEITSDDVIQDDGSADINGEHDNFEEGDGNVDISDYGQSN